MQIKLKFIDKQILLTVPACKSFDALHRAFMGGYPMMVLADVWEQLDRDEPAQFELPATGWRHLLRGLLHSYKFHSTYEKPADTVVEPLLFIVDGVEYETEEAIPYRKDFTHSAGEFTLSQPQLIAIDSCYHNVDREAVALTALPGTWKAHATMRDEFNGFATALLAVAHESVTDNVFDPALYESEIAGIAGVDSGTCGFFDRSAYPTDEAAHEHEDGTFYKGCCDATDCKADYHDKPRALPLDIVPGGVGVNSRTFIGDGAYRCFVRKNAEGIVIAACLVFDYSDKAFRDPELEDDEDAEEAGEAFFVVPKTPSYRKCNRTRRPLRSARRI